MFPRVLGYQWVSDITEFRVYKLGWHKRFTPSKKHLQQEIRPHLVGLRSPCSWQKSPSLCPFIYYKHCMHHLSLQIKPSRYELRNGCDEPCYKLQQASDLLSLEVGGGKEGVGCVLHTMEDGTCPLPDVKLTNHYIR